MQKHAITFVVTVLAVVAGQFVMKMINKRKADNFERDMD
jgi:hypothetical protein